MQRWRASRLDAQSVGEIGIVGVAAAVPNATYQAVDAASVRKIESGLDTSALPEETTCLRLKDLDEDRIHVIELIRDIETDDPLAAEMGAKFLG